MDKAYMSKVYEEIINKLKTGEDIRKVKKSIASKYKLKKHPANFEILMHADAEDIDLLRSILLTKPTRSISGVAPAAVMTKPISCPHGRCIYCPGGPGSTFGDLPQSYTGKEPASMRAIRNDYDPYLQIFNRLKQYVLLGHNCEKVELIVMGGTFPSFSKEYQEEFITYSFKAMNDFSDLFYTSDKGFDILKFKRFFNLPGEIGDDRRNRELKARLIKIKGKSSLEIEKEKNESSKIRCIAMCIETKPDFGRLKEGNELLRLGCTRVEVGIQSVYEDVVRFINRGHSVKESIESTAILKDLGFKVAYHYMPGLPLTDRERDINGMKELFENSDFRPDMIKLYPCMVAEGTGLYDLFKRGKFSPIDSKEAVYRISKLKEVIPEYCRIQRIQRDVPTKQWSAGVEMTNLRQLISSKEVKCRCIRCREPRGELLGNYKLKIMRYDSSGGKEFFISAEDSVKDRLYGFVRLRLPKRLLREEITERSALIRELHVYGRAAGIGSTGDVQHKGIGKELMKRAEETAVSSGKNKILVLSGVGVKEYYRNIGYVKEGPYMAKYIQN